MVEEEFRYDHPPSAVFGLVGSGRFQVELLAELGGQDPEVLEESHTPSGGLRVVTRLRTGVEFPGFARKIVPPDTAVTHTYEWGPPLADGTVAGTWSTEIKGAPLLIGGTTAIRPEGDGAVHLYKGQIKASVPVIGGRLEVFALDNLRRDLAHSARFIADRLAVS